MAENARYTALQKVADGGMAEIFLARQHGGGGFRRLVVLKRILPAAMADPSTRETLLDEAHIAMRLHHNNIVEVLDVGESAGQFFLVLELVDGWSLSRVVKRAREAGKELPLELALFIIAETCRGLAYAHTRTEDGEALDIVHRDISPQNILLSVEGEVKVTDFGIARASTRGERTAQGLVKGKPAWMSPEQAKGSPLDARSDVFSVGTMLYTLVTGTHPFRAATDLETMLRVQAAKFPPPSKDRSDLPKSVVRIINKAMKKDPDERFDSAEEMLVALEKALRSSSKPAGQTELKAWLRELSAKDGEGPLSEKGPPPPARDTQPTEPSSEWIELSEIGPSPHTAQTQKATNPGQAPTRRLPDKVLKKKAKPKRSPVLRFVLLMLLLAGSVWMAWLYAPKEVWDRLGIERPGAATKVTPPAPAPKPDTPPTTDWAPFPRDKRDTAVLFEPPKAGADAGAALDAGPARDAAAPAAKPGAEVTPANTTPAAETKDAAAKDADKADADDTVYVKVISDPTGATVKVGGRALGTTPTKLRFHNGTVFEVTFEKAGYHDATRRFIAGARPNQTLKGVLKPAK